MTAPLLDIASIPVPVQPGSHPWTYLLAVAIGAGVVTGLLAGTRRTGRGRGWMRDRIMARVIETMLYDGSAPSIGATLRDLWRDMAPALLAELPKMLAGVLLLGLPALWLSGWIELRPLRPGDRTLFEAITHTEARARDLRIEVSKGLVVETPALAVGGPTTATWRVLVLDACPPDAWIELRTRQQGIRMAVTVERASEQKTEQRTAQGMKRLASRPHGKDNAVERVSIGYPVAGLTFGHRSVPWLPVYLAVASVSMWGAMRWRRRHDHE